MGTSLPQSCLRLGERNIAPWMGGNLAVFQPYALSRTHQFTHVYSILTHSGKEWYWNWVVGFMLRSRAHERHWKDEGQAGRMYLYGVLLRLLKSPCGLELTSLAGAITRSAGAVAEAKTRQCRRMEAAVENRFNQFGTDRNGDKWPNMISSSARPFWTEVWLRSSSLESC